MKKRIAFLLCMCLFICLYATSYADSQVYVLPDLNMTIDIPDHFEVVTDNLVWNEDKIREYGELGEAILSNDSTGVSLDAWDSEASLEIAITTASNIMGDYNQFSDTTLLTLATAMSSLAEQLGGQVYSTTVFQGAQAKFLKFDEIMPNESGSDRLDHIIQYNTAYAEKTINVTLHSYNGEIDDQTAAEFEQVVSSVRFLSNPAAAPEKESSASFVYTDEDTGVTFTVPENWKEEPLSQDRQYLDVKFISTEEQGLSMMYGSSDVWAELSESDRQGFSRSDLNNDAFSEADIAAVMGDSGADIRRVVYGNVDYFQTTTKQSSSAYGLDMSVTMTIVSRFENGILYQFQFPGTEDNPYFGDFVSMVSSAVYPEFNPSLMRSVDPESTFIFDKLKFGMTGDQVHQTLGVLPDDVNSIHEFYYDNYDLRPSKYDEDRIWEGTSQDIIFSVSYDIFSEDKVAYSYGFAVTDTIASEEYIDYVFEYISYICSMFGEPDMKEEPDLYWFYWTAPGSMIYMSLYTKDDTLRFSVGQTAEH